MIESQLLFEIQPPTRDLRIVKAAIKLGDKVYVGWRHSEILGHIAGLGLPKTSQDDQGFVASNGSFYNRYQSARIALRARQISRLPHVLTSEDLWDKDGTPRDGEPYDPMGDRKSAPPVNTAIEKAREMIARTKGRR